MDEKLSSLPPGGNLSDSPLSDQNNGPFSFLTRNPLASIIRDAYKTFNQQRSFLNLSYPGTVEGVSREVTRDVFLNSQMFTGFRAEFQKTLSANPTFQIAHHLTMGGNQMPPYSFAAIYGSPQLFLQGNVDNDFQVSARANLRLASNFIAKSNFSFSPDGANQTMVQLESEYQGADFNASVKAMNPSLTDNPLTGAFVGQYLQAVTPRLSLGLEAMWQRASNDEGPQTAITYVGRYRSENWMAGTQVLPQGGLEGWYWRRLTDKVEAGVEIKLQLLGLAAAGGGPMMGAMKNEGSATIGAKYDFLTSTFRAQVDSGGKVGACLEKRIAPPISLTFAGEMDHSKNTARMGLAISIDSSSFTEEEEEQMKRSAEGVAPPPF